jgi:hypothetical protein
LSLVQITKQIGCIFIKNELFHIGLGDIWYNQNYINDSGLCDIYFATIKQRLQDNLKQGFDGEMKNSVKCCNYQYIVDNLLLQYYLTKGIPELYRNCITKIRLSSHNLAIESERFTGITRLNRICMILKMSFILYSNVKHFKVLEIYKVIL